MVFFNCNACGEALKKNQVEKHTLRCRFCQVLSCVDCGKDFWGNDYQKHTKCMTEEEKYCGQGYVAKVNKGEVKQEQWIEKVQVAIDKSSSNPGLKRLLIRLKDYPNIPRKQQKFQNFLKNSLRINDISLITQVWDILMAHSAQDESKKENKENGQPKADRVEETISQAAGQDGTDTAIEPTDQKKSKREKKEERRNKANKKEKKDKGESNELSEESVKIRKKKRKHQEMESETEVLDVNDAGKALPAADDQPKKKKKKKNSSKDVEANGEVVGHEEHDENCHPEEEEPKKKKCKFNWEETITKVLEDKGEISIKKLRKKVLGEFAAIDAANYSEENLLAKFDKKVRKMSTVQVLKERVKLKEK